MSKRKVKPSTLSLIAGMYFWYDGRVRLGPV